MSVKDWVKNNGSVLLTVGSVLGTIGTGIVSAICTPKALEKKRTAEKRKGSKLTFFESFVTMAPSYIPAAGIALGAIGCEIGLGVQNRHLEKASSAAIATVASTVNIIKERIKDKPIDYIQHDDEYKQMLYEDEESKHLEKEDIPIYSDLFEWDEGGNGGYIWTTIDTYAQMVSTTQRLYSERRQKYGFGYVFLDEIIALLGGTPNKDVTGMFAFCEDEGYGPMIKYNLVQRDYPEYMVYEFMVCESDENGPMSHSCLSRLSEEELKESSGEIPPYSNSINGVKWNETPDECFERNGLI